jgi:hypothetical protein
MINLLISGDLYMDDIFKSQALINSDVAALFTSANFRIVNLEARLTADVTKNKILKTSLNLRMSC